MPEINGVSLPFLPAGGAVELKRQTSSLVNRGQGISFNEIFQTELNKLKFSSHAQTRMLSREIMVTENEMIRLQDAVIKSENKGGKETLVLFGDKAFIVNVPNRTVITAMNREQLDTSVITNIDSAVIA